MIAAKGQLTSQGAKSGYFTVKEPFAQTSLDQNSICKFPEDKLGGLHHPFCSSELSPLPPQARESHLFALICHSCIDFR